MNAVRLALLAAGSVLAVLAYRVQVDDLHSPRSRALAAVAVGVAFLVAGVIAWSRRPANRLGPLMSVAGVALLARQFRYSEDAVAFTIFFAFGELGYALLAHSAFAYPTGRVADRLERLFLGAAYAAALLFPIATLLFYDGSEPLRYVFFPRESLISIDGDMGVVRFLEKAFVVVAYGVLASLFILLIFRRLWRASVRARRVLTPLLLAAAAAGLRAVFECLTTFWTPPPSFAVDNVYWWQITAFVAMPLALLAGLLNARLAHASVGELVLRLERAAPNEIRGELARALHDPSLDVFFWLPERSEYVDADGHAAALPPDDDRRAVTIVASNGQTLAALVHDPTLRDDPGLVDAAAAAARLSLENARLHAEVRSQLDKVKESRARLVNAASEERRRIERDLHDGAQQRLLALAMELGSAQGSADADVEQLLAAAVDELKVAVNELRELARGIHPAVLTEGGLGAAVEALAARAAVPVEIDAQLDGRPPPNVEATAYFVVSEALNNVVKHAGAAHARITARQTDSLLVVEIEDDGRGGAAVDGDSGSGLRGLVDRVEAHGGQLRVESPDGGGTRIVAEIPCAS